MKALVKARPMPGIDLQEVPFPRVVEGEVLVRVGLVGICGTDLSFFEWKAHVREYIDLPRVIGHEFVGRVVGTADESRDLIDVRVTADTDGGCGNCQECRRGWWNACLSQERVGTQRDGALAEHIAVPLRSLHRLPDDLDDRIACLLEPMGAAVHAVSQFPNFLGQTALVIGPGPIGLLGGLALRAGGASPVHILGVPGDEYRLEYAERLGLHPVLVTNNRVPADLHLREFEVILDAVGNDVSLEMSTDLCRFGGHIVVVGLGGGTSLNIGRLVSRQLHLVGSWRRRPEIWPRTITLARDHPEIADMVQTYEWADYEAAFAALKDRSHIKVAIKAPPSLDGLTNG